VAHFSTHETAHFSTGADRPVEDIVFHHDLLNADDPKSFFSL
jgi:hypothetical protein